MQFNLPLIRSILAMSQTYLANELGIPVAVIDSIEKGTCDLTKIQFLAIFYVIYGEVGMDAYNDDSHFRFYLIWDIIDDGVSDKLKEVIDGLLPSPIIRQ